MATSGVCRYPSPEAPFLQKPIDLVDTAFSLFKFLPVDGDVRWAFLVRYNDIKKRVGFRPINFENAWGATYLSAVPSYRSGFVSSLNAENCLQLQRALDNVGLMREMPGRFAASQSGFEQFDMQLRLTDRLMTDPTRQKRIVTPCPEALYQVRLNYGQYLARVGFNLHSEDGGVVLSLVNIQGTPGSSERNADFQFEFGVRPFNALVQRVLALASVEEPVYDVRGIINPLRGNAQLYWGVLAAEGVAMHHAFRRPPLEAEV